STAASHRAIREFQFHSLPTPNGGAFTLPGGIRSASAGGRQSARRRADRLLFQERAEGRSDARRFGFAGKSRSSYLEQREEGRRAAARMAGPHRAGENDSGERRHEPVRMGFAVQRSDPSTGRILQRYRPKRSTRFAGRLPSENDSGGKIANRAAENSGRSAQQRVGAGVAKTICAIPASHGPHFAIASGDQRDSRSERADQKSAHAIR